MAMGGAKRPQGGAPNDHRGGEGVAKWPQGGGPFAGGCRGLAHIYIYILYICIYKYIEHTEVLCIFLRTIPHHVYHKNLPLSCPNSELYWGHMDPTIPGISKVHLVEVPIRSTKELARKGCSSSSPRPAMTIGPSSFCFQ